MLTFEPGGKVRKTGILTPLQEGVKDCPLCQVPQSILWMKPRKISVSFRVEKSKTDESILRGKFDYDVDLKSGLK